MSAPLQLPPCVVHEDDDILVVHKPAGLNTHSPAPYAGEGLFEWLRDREPRWSKLSILHRLDRETSGLMVFGLSPRANRALTQQFTERVVQKEYLLGVSAPVAWTTHTVRSDIQRVGDRYLARPGRAGAESAITDFSAAPAHDGIACLRAQPHTGRTHQIRVHAAHAGFPILGDVLYGGAPSHRVWLHAERLTFHHPATQQRVTYAAPPRFSRPNHLALRSALIHPAETDAYRWWHGEGEAEARDGSRDRRRVYVDRLGSYLLAQSDEELSEAQRRWLEQAVETERCQGLYHKRLQRHVRRSEPAAVGPQWLQGEKAPEFFPVRENGLRFDLSFGEGYSVGLFLDQRDNRRRWLTGHVGAEFGSLPRSGSIEKPTMLNLFAYTCGFSVAAAQGGWHTTSLDLSRKYLDWGRRTMEVNGLDAGAHDFIYGDVFSWLRRLQKKERRFDSIVVDPPTFSQSKESGVFRAERDYGKLMAALLPLLSRGGVVLVSCNAAEWAPEEFLATIQNAVGGARRTCRAVSYAPQPPDFPVTRAEPAYLKTAWLRID